MTEKKKVSIEEIANQITDFKQGICDLMDSGTERSLGEWRTDKKELERLVDVGKKVAKGYINGAVKATLLILIDNALDTVDNIDVKIISLGGILHLEEVTDIMESEEISVESLAAEEVEEELTKKEESDAYMNSSSNIQIQRIFNRTTKGYCFKKFTYIEDDEKVYEMTANDLKRKKYQGDINGFHSFLTDKGHKASYLPVIEAPDLVRSWQR